MLATLGLAPPGLAPPGLAPHELMVVQTLMMILLLLFLQKQSLVDPPEPEVCHHLRRHRESARDDLQVGCGLACGCFYFFLQVPSYARTLVARVLNCEV
jgi:hypothetical protein